MKFKILGIDHIGLAPKDAKVANHFFKNILSLPVMNEEVVETEMVEVSSYASNFGENKKISTQLEVLRPTGENSTINRFLEKKGGGIHHICLRVDNIESAIEELIDKEVELIDQKIRLGANNTKVAFIHPRSCGGLLIELVEKEASHT